MELQVNAFLAHLETQPGYTRSTRSAYASDLRVFLEFTERSLGRPAETTDLEARHISRFLEAERLAGRSLSTRMRRLAVLRQFARFLNCEELPAWKDFPVQASREQDKKATAGPPASLTEDQVQKLLAAMQAASGPRALRDTALFMLLLESGLQATSLSALDLTDIDLRRGKLHCTGPHGTDLWLSMGAATGPLERYVREGRPDLSHRPAEPALFISQINGRLSRQGIWQVLKAWGLAVSPPIDLSPRLLRNTAVVRMAQSGKPLSELQVLLGHRNPLSTRSLLRRLGATGSHQKPRLSR